MTGGPPRTRPPPLEDDDGQDKHLHAPVLRLVLHVFALPVSTATATGPAAPTAGFIRLKGAWRGNVDGVDVVRMNFLRPPPKEITTPQVSK